MKNYKVRYHDQQIKQMLRAGSRSREMRKYGISPKRIARVNRGETCNPPGHPRKFNEEHKEFIEELVMSNPHIKSSEIQKIFKEKFKMTISSYSVSIILNGRDFFYGKPIKIQKINKCAYN